MSTNPVGNHNGKLQRGLLSEVTRATFHRTTRQLKLHNSKPVKCQAPNDSMVTNTFLNNSLLLNNSTFSNLITHSSQFNSNQQDLVSAEWVVC